MLTDIPKPKSYNLGGLATFEFVHFTAVNSWPGIFDSRILSPIVLNNGYSWLKGYSTPLTLAFSEPAAADDNGKCYEPEVIGFVPGNSTELVDLMHLMEGHEFIVKLNDPNGKVRIVGSHGYPLTFSSSFTTGATRDEAKGFNFKFAGKCIFRAPIYL